MPSEVFARPLVKTVAFQVTFPSLFSIESKVGDFQSAIMAQFPESALLLKHQFVIVQRVEGNEMPEPVQAQQIWQFKNTDNVTVDVSKDSLSVTSESHKTYQLDGHPKFRDVIDLVCGNFFKLTRIPLIHRIGLRYINRCPLSAMTNERYRKFYNSALPLDRFPLEDAHEMDVTAIANRGDVKVRCNESIKHTKEGLQVTFDIDAWKERIDAANILATADALHDVISSEFNAFTTPDLLAYMKTTSSESP